MGLGRWVGEGDGFGMEMGWRVRGLGEGEGFGGVRGGRWVGGRRLMSCGGEK